MQPLENSFPGLGVPSLGGHNPLPPESRKGWLIALASLAVLVFGLMAFGVLSNGLHSFTQREHLNTTLEIESRMRGCLLFIRRMQEGSPELAVMKNPRPVFQAQRTNYRRFHDEFSRAIKTYPQNLPALARLDSAVQDFFVQEESILRMEDRIQRAQNGKAPAAAVKKLVEGKQIHLDSTRFSFLKAHGCMQEIEENLQAERKELAAFQIRFFKRLYLVPSVSMLFGIAMVWLLVRMRSGQKREQSVSESLFQTLAEIKATEQALRKSNERFHLAASATSGVIYDLDIEKNRIIWTENISSVFGYPLEDVEPALKWWEERLHPSDLARIQNQLKENLAAGKDFIGEYRFRHKNGHYTDVWDKGRVVLDASGKVVRMVGSMVDVTERKQAEEEMMRARDAALEQANLKSQFLANMSHEIRTPMNGVLGYLGLLADRAFADEREMTEFVRGAHTSAESLLALINDILDFSKIEAGKLTFENIKFDLRSVVEQTAELLALRAEQKGIELACLVEYGAPLFLKGDPTRLRQILVNLAGNAVKFTEKGEIVIRVSLIEEGDQGAKIHFSVKDTGVGIPPEKHHLLFQSFTQIDGSSTRRFGGTGLGLAISKQLVELMGGQIGFESSPGTGSNFWFEVTLTKDNSGQPPLVSTADIENLSVLVVDDNAVNRDILCRMIQSFNCRPFPAASGEEALQILRQQIAEGDPIRLAILDFQMPGCTGEELGRQIKSDATLNETVLMLITSVGARGDAERVKKAGFAAYLKKPVRQSQLLEGIMAVMARAFSGEQPPEEQPLITRHSLEEAKRGGMILLAEDNPVNQAVAEAILTRAGYTVVIAANGREAVEILKSKDFDVVLMDVQMPEMDGYEATGEIRKLSGTKAKVPIIAMTAHAMSGDREKCLEAGMDDYVSKPINSAELREVIERWRKKNPPVKMVSSEKVREAGTPVDLNRLLDAAGGDKNFCQELVALFFADSEKRLSALEGGLSRGAADTVEAQAHALRGASANLGAESLSKIFAEIEDMAAAGRLEQCLRSVPRAKEELERVRNFLLSQEKEKV